MLELAILISLGGIIMAFAVFKTQQLTNSDYIKHYRKTWNFLKYFMMIFFIGYIAVLIFVLFGHSRIIQSVTGAIFFLGALFVYLTVRTGYNTINDLHNTTVSKEYLNTIVDSMAGTLIVLRVDSDLLINKVNQATINLLGYEREDLVNHSIKKIFKSKKKLNYYLEKCKSGNWLTNENADYFTKDGKKIPVLLSISCITDSESNMKELIIAAQDITERIESEKTIKRSEKKYRNLSKELAESNLLKELLLDVIAHDLKNPAAIIKGFAELETEINPNNLNIQEINNGTDKLLEVINNATVISKVATGDNIEKNEINLTEMINSVVSNLKPELEDAKMTVGVKIEKQISLSVNPIISEIFQNYITNAIKYAKSGEKLIIESEENDKDIKFNFIDFGTTIPEKERENIFKRNVQLKNSSGTGLGLAIVERIAKAHNAKVGILPNTPRGNIFYLQLYK